MREIKFRGKPVKPYAKTVKEDGSIYIEFEYGGFYRDFEYGGCPEGKDYIICFNSTGLGYNEHVLVEKTSVGQYTGLKDKNGREIYEGDILIICDEDFGDTYSWIEFENGSFIVKEKDCGDTMTLSDLMCLDPEVVGNMYDNPELINE